MPWKEQREMDLKLSFVEKASLPGSRMSAVCKEYGISRETGYKWLNRFKREGAAGLGELSRRPKSTPLSTAEEVVLAVLEIRDAYPRRGPKKLLEQLKRKLGDQTPSVATIARILQRFGRVRQRSRFRRRVSVVEKAPSVQALECNDVWTVDFKGWWRAQDGQRCEPLTVRDAYSRFIFTTKVLKSPSMSGVRAVFEQLFRRYGLPRYIQCDNGAPFICVQARGGLTRLSAWWVSLGIRVIRSRPGCPQDNGGHERMHRDMREDLQSYPAGTLALQQQECDRWKHEFNHVRPHEALKGRVPADVYRASERKKRVTGCMYPSDWIVRAVTRTGALNVNGSQVTAGRAVAGLAVALQPLGGTRYRMWFRHVDMGDVELEIPDCFIDEVSEQFIEKQPREARKKPWQTRASTVNVTAISS
jgi:putative transposase